MIEGLQGTPKILSFETSITSGCFNPPKFILTQYPLELVLPQSDCQDKNFLKKNFGERHLYPGTPSFEFRFFFVFSTSCFDYKHASKASSIKSLWPLRARMVYFCKEKHLSLSFSNRNPVQNRASQPSGPTGYRICTRVREIANGLISLFSYFLDSRSQSRTFAETAGLKRGRGRNLRFRI